MNKLTTVIALLIISLGNVTAQTFNPSCFSNAKGWTITKIESTYDGTYVYLSLYIYSTNYNFYINPGMYIEDYNNSNSKKCQIIGFVDNQLNTTYSATPYTEYDFTLKFEKIPDSWTDINIAEPPAGNDYTAWYWNDISLNRPSSERLKKDNFLLYHALDFFKSFAHPTNILKKYTYNVDYNSIQVTLYYADGYLTDLKLTFDGDLITNVYVVKNEDWVPAFTLLELIRDVIFKDDPNREYTSKFEQLLNKTINEMSGQQLAAVALTCMYNATK